MFDQRLNPTTSLLLPALLQAWGRRLGTSHPDPLQPRPAAGSSMQDGELSEGGTDEFMDACWALAPYLQEKCRV